MSDDLQTRLEQALRERDETVADNAALLGHLKRMVVVAGRTDGSDDGEYMEWAQAKDATIEPRPGAALLRELLALRGVAGLLRPHAERWRELGATLTNGWLERHEVCALIAACAEADKARENTP